MAKKKSQKYRIDTKASSSPLVINAENIETHADDKVAVNLRYYQRGYECFSKWRGVDLKSFSQFVVKMSERTVSDVQSTTKKCHSHKGKTRKLPSEVSEDVRMYSLVVNPKARVHGFFESNNFYLVWLDREHKILKS